MVGDCTALSNSQILNASILYKQHIQINLYRISSLNTINMKLFTYLLSSDVPEPKFCHLKLLTRQYKDTVNQ